MCKIIRRVHTFEDRNYEIWSALKTKGYGLNVLSMKTTGLVKVAKPFVI